MATKRSLKEQHIENAILELMDMQLHPHQIRMLWNVVRNPNYTGPIIYDAIAMMDILERRRRDLGRGDKFKEGTNGDTQTGT